MNVTMRPRNCDLINIKFVVQPDQKNIKIRGTRLKSESFIVTDAAVDLSQTVARGNSSALSTKLQRCLGVAVSSLLITAMSVSSTSAQIEFEEKTSTAAKFDDVESWGASWGDMNGDLWPDLFVTNHRMRPSLFRNNGDGTFTNVVLQWDTSRTWLNDPLADEHGGSWSDFDEDGDLDLSVITGIAFDGHLFINEGTNFVEKGAQYGLTDDREGRLPLWFDYNNDGNIDLAYMSGSSARMFEWTPNPPVDPPVAPYPYKTVSDFPDSKLGHWCFRNQYGFLIDLDGDDVMELVCASEGNFPQHALDYETGVFEINTELLTDQVSNSVDSTTGDFDGDLLPDILVMRGNLMPNEAQYIPDANGDNKRIESWLSTGAGNGVRTVQFRTQGPVDFIAMSNQIAVPWRIHLGINAIPLGPVQTNMGNATTPFTVDPADVNSHGNVTDDPLFDPDGLDNRGTYVGYDPVTDLWSITMAPGVESVRALYVIESANTITDLNVIGTALRDGPVSPAMLMNTTTGVDSTAASMFNPVLRGDIAQQMMCVSATAGDFDNDMDLDIYVVCRGGVENLPNRLFENDGTGFFTEVTGAGGAEGVVGLGLQSGAGTGESVIMADYDVDGLLDLFVTNGLNLQPFREGGPDQLFRNKTVNGNNWTLIDLEGTTSNRDGVGASLYATTADGTVQLREQNGGYHRWSQHHTRIHFGLGANTQFDLEVRWPSGLIETHTGINSNQLVKVVEGGSVQTLTMGAAVGDPPVEFEDRCGSPRYQVNEDIGLFVWKDCATDIWTVELVSGDSNTPIGQAGIVETNKSVIALSTDSFEANDLLDPSPGAFDPTNTFLLDFRMAAVAGGRDAFSFQLESDAGGCLILDAPELEIFLGAGHVRANSPLNLADPSLSCESIASSNVTVNEGDGVAEVIVSMSLPATQQVTVDAITVDGTATAPADYGQIGPVPQTVVIDIGETSGVLSIPIIDDAVFEPTETFTVEFSNATIVDNLIAPVTVTIVDNDTSQACGKPTYNPAVDRQLTLWKDCGSDNWHIETSAGGGTGIFHTGTLESDVNLNSWSTVSFESNDFTQPPADPADPQHNPTPASITYSMRMSGAGTDGLDFSVANSATTCLTTNDPSIPIVVGSAGTVVNSPFNINTLGPCVVASIDISIGDISISEGAGTASVPVTLSASANVSVDVNTIAGTADAVNDFQPIVGQTLNFVSGGPVTQTVDVTIVDDSTVETTELFDVALSNAVGGSIIDGSASVNILDNDTAGSPVCGEPSVLPVSPNSARALYIWNDCGSDVWHMRATSGNTGNDADHLGNLGISNGSLVPGSYPVNPPYDNSTANSDFGMLSFEGVDQFATIFSPIEYRFKMNGGGFDGVDFEVSSGSSLCLTPTNTDSSLVVLLGANATPAPAGAFELTSPTLGSCSVSSTPSVSISDASVTENAGTALLTLTLSAPATASASVSALTTDGTATAGSDYTPITSPQVVNFTAGGSLSQTISIPILDDTSVESTENFLVNLNAANGLVIADGSGLVSIVDDDNAGVSCGAPSYDANTERAMFMWRECGTQVWQIRATAGGSGQPAATHLGKIDVQGSLINQSYPYNVPYDNSIVQRRFAKKSFEGIDYIIAPAGSNPTVDYRMRMGGAGFDGFEFEANPGTILCLTNQSPSLPILLGSQKVPLNGQNFNPETNQVCN